MELLVLQFVKRTLEHRELHAGLFT
jgi:hypothetical protein